MICYSVILYNKRVDDSVTLSNLRKFVNNSDIIVFDNSTKDEIRLSNQKYFKDRNYIYLSNPQKNIGLSKAYNEVLCHILSNKEKQYNYICWLDDDTEISQTFLYELNEGAKKEADIIVPKIYGQDGKIYSPNEAGLLKNKLVLNNEKDIKNEKFNAINSCLTVKLKIYENYKYNEILFLDQVDQLFFDSLEKSSLKFCILDVIILQDFSQRNENLGTSYLQRFKIRTKDLIFYGKLSPKNNIFFTYFKNIFLGLNFSLKTRCSAYFFIGVSSIKYLFRNWR